jgi:tRNA A58 N-methylase Trm61
MPDTLSITDEEAQIICASCPENGLVIETGTHKGLGAERIAKHLPEGARLLTLEAFDDLAEQARERLKDDPRVTVICADSTQYVHCGRNCNVLVLDCFDRLAAYKNLAHCLTPDATVFIHDMDKAGPKMGLSALNIEVLPTLNALGRVV